MKASRKTAVVLSIVMVLTLAVSIFTPAFAVTQSQIDSLKDKQQQVSAAKDALESQMAQLDVELSTVMERKAALDEQNQLAQQEIELINEQIDLYTQLIEKKAQELEEAKAAEAKQAEELRVRMRVMEENGKLSYFSILFKATSFTDFLSKLDDISRIMEYDKALEEAYIAARQHVEDVKAEYEATKAENEAKKIELEEKKAQLEIRIEEATQLIVQLEADIEEYKIQYEASEAQEAEISSQIDKLVKELERQQAAAGGGSITGTGSYIWPLPGYSPGSAYGWRMHPILHVMKFHAGEDIGAPSGTPILASDSGTVVLSTYGSGYGNYVTISHGGGRVTLYAHMSSRAVEAGAAVTQGQVIGYVGSTGMSTGPHLHFEVRVNGATTDPKSYFNF